VFNLSSAAFTLNSAAQNGGAVCSGNGAVFNADNVVFSSNTASFGGAVYLSGSKANFSGANITFTGNTAESAGGALYIAGSTATFDTNGAEVIFSGNKAAGKSNDVYMDVGSQLNISGANAIRFEGGILSDLSGQGIEINKSGAGAMYFGGENQVWGNFNISGGDIILLDSATFTGTSMVLPAGSALDMQNASLNTIIVSTFSSTTNTKIDIFANRNSDKVIAGNATAGGNLDVKSRVGVYNDVVYEIILSTLTPVQGTFTSTSSYYGNNPNENLTYTVDNSDPNKIKLIVNGSWLTDFGNIGGLSFNQQETANAFDKLTKTSTSNMSNELADLLTAMMSENEADQKAVLSQVSGYYLSNVIRNLAADSPNNEIYDKIRNHAREDVTNSGLWAAVKGGQETFKGDDNSLGDYTNNSIGALLGFDRYIADSGLMWGAYLRFSSDSIEQDEHSADGTKKGLGLYGGLIKEGYEFKAMLMGSIDNFDTQRAVLGATAKGSIDAVTVNGDIEAALKFALNESKSFKLRPYIGLEAENSMYDGFTETGAGALNLEVKGGSYLRTAGRAGAGIEYNRKEWSIYVKGEGKYIISGDAPEIESVFEGTDVSFKSRGAKEGVMQYGVGLGGEVFVSENWKLFANGNYYGADNYENIYGNVGLRYLFGGGKKQSKTKACMRDAEENARDAEKLAEEANMGAADAQRKAEEAKAKEKEMQGINEKGVKDLVNAMKIQAAKEAIAKANETIAKADEANKKIESARECKAQAGEGEANKEKDYIEMSLERAQTGADEARENALRTKEEATRVLSIGGDNK